MNGTKVKAIIFDCFGVIAVDGWTPFKQRYFGDDPAKLDEAEQLNHQTDAGLLAYEDYVAKIAAMAGVAPADFRRAIEHTQIDQRLMEFICDELKPNYKIGMLSNVASDWLVRELSPAQRDLFDVLALSSQTGLAKPEPAAFEHVLDELGVRANEAIFTDDQPTYCASARQLGMAAIDYQSFEQFRVELEGLLKR